MFVMGLAVTESLRMPPVTKEANRRTWNLIQKCKFVLIKDYIVNQLETIVAFLFQSSL